METLLAVLTPPGKAAIATIAVRGPDAWRIVRELFQPRTGTMPDEPSAGRFWFGRLGAELRDEVILAVKDGASVELHCHGGIAVVRMIEELFTVRGARVVAWQELVSEIEHLLAHAPTARSASILLDQSLRAWEQRDEDSLARLRDLIPLGQHLVAPWKVVLAGAPNVGKSSLMNALAGFTRSVVSPTPGTTRDVVTLRVAIDGWPVELIDMAGLRETDHELEKTGIERARSAIRDADLRLWLLDGAAESVFPPSEEGWIYVINKIDLTPAWDWNCADALRVSAQTGAGLPELCDAISRRLVPNPPAPGEAVPCTPEQIEWVLQKAQTKR